MECPLAVLDSLTTRDGHVKQGDLEERREKVLQEIDRRFVVNANGLPHRTSFMSLIPTTDKTTPDADVNTIVVMKKVSFEKTPDEWLEFTMPTRQRSAGGGLTR